MAELLGMRILVSNACGADIGYDDWRERLRRNLSRPSTGLWEPLHRRLPDVLLIDGSNPRNCAVLTNLCARPSPEGPQP